MLFDEYLKEYNQVLTYHRYGSTQGTYPQTADQPPDRELLPRGEGQQLDDYSYDKHAAFQNHRPSPAHCVCNGSTCQRADQGANGQKADNQPCSDH